MGCGVDGITHLSLTRLSFDSTYNDLDGKGVDIMMDECLWIRVKTTTTTTTTLYIHLDASPL